VTHPYKGLDTRAFWRASIGSRHFADIEQIWNPIDIGLEDKVATAGSCFAQHIGRSLQERGANFLDVEPPTVSFSSKEEARRWGFNVYSARYGNIYTSRQLRQLFLEAFGQREPQEIVWEKDGRFFDALRPSIDPVGQDNVEDVLKLREGHLSAVRRMFRELDLFVFTMGLTEGWESTSDGTMYPVAPGTAAGDYDRRKYQFRNLRYSQIMQDMREFWKMLKEVNPKARMLLTVSPVPLAATASGDHVLPATTYSKSVLRAVAGDLTSENEDISYFPSYEIITAPAARGMFYDPDLRNVNQFGVDLVMDHFFSGSLGETFVASHQNDDQDDGELICDEGRLDISQAV
jgi:hypothetical protein